MIVNVEGRHIDGDDLIDSVEELREEETIMTCVSAGKNVFEVTMVTKDCRNGLIPMISVAGVDYMLVLLARLQR